MFAPVSAGMGGMMLPDPGGMMPPRMGGPKTGMFGAGAEKPKLDLAGLLQGMIGGYLAGSGKPGGAAILSMMQQRQQAKDDEANYQRRREDGFQDYVRKEAWDIANKPQQGQQPHYFEDNAGNLMAVGPDGKPQMVHKDPLQWKLVPNGLGGVVPVNLQELMAGQSGPVGKITPIDGGPTPQASGGFR